MIVTPNDLTTFIVTILSVLLGGGFLGGLVAWRKQSKAEPIEAETAAVINAKTAGDLALALAREQNASIVQLRVDQTNQRDNLVLTRQEHAITRAELAATRDELALTRRELDALRTTLSGVVPWIKDLFERWHEHRLLDEPPGGLPPGVV